MTKTEQLTDLVRTLTDAQLDGVLSYVGYLRGEPEYLSAPAEALASIERGLADKSAGRFTMAEDVFRQIDAKIGARGQ